MQYAEQILTDKVTCVESAHNHKYEDRSRHSILAWIRALGGRNRVCNSRLMLSGCSASRQRQKNATIRRFSSAMAVCGCAYKLATPLVLRPTLGPIAVTDAFPSKRDHSTRLVRLVVIYISSVHSNFPSTFFAFEAGCLGTECI